MGGGGGGGNWGGRPGGGVGGVEGGSGVRGLGARLRGGDPADMEPMAHALDAHLPSGQRLRPDEVSERDQRERFQAVAPSTDKGLYLVPKVIE